MSDLRITPADAEAISGLHGDAADGIEGTASSSPGTVDAGPASAAIAAILARVGLEADDLALVHRGAEELMDQTATDYAATDESVDAAFDQLTEGVPEGWTR